MKISKRWLVSRDACESSLAYVCKNGYIGLDGISFVEKLLTNDRLSDASWLVVRLMSKTQVIEYIIFAAEYVIDIYEEQYPDNDRPRKAIEAAKEYLKNPCEKTEIAAIGAGNGAACVNTAYAYAAAASVAAYAAYIVNTVAYNTVATADAAVAYAIYTVKTTAYDTSTNFKIKMIRHGLKILSKKRD